jgi:hypothetical protein
MLVLLDLSLGRNQIACHQLNQRGLTCVMKKS